MEEIEHMQSEINRLRNFLKWIIDGGIFEEVKSSLDNAEDGRYTWPARWRIVSERAKHALNGTTICPECSNTVMVDDINPETMLCSTCDYNIEKQKDEDEYHRRTWGELYDDLYR